MVVAMVTMLMMKAAVDEMRAEMEARRIGLRGSVVDSDSGVITDLGDTAVQAAWLFTHEVGDDQFADVEDNANYWTFVVVTWLPIYALIYWATRAA